MKLLAVIGVLLLGGGVAAAIAAQAPPAVASVGEPDAAHEVSSHCSPVPVLDFHF